MKVHIIINLILACGKRSSVKLSISYKVTAPNVLLFSVPSSMHKQTLNTTHFKFSLKLKTNAFNTLLDNTHHKCNT